jgi:hypothetical protein
LRFLGFKISKNHVFEVARFQGVEVPRNHSFEVYINQGFRFSRYPGFKEGFGVLRYRGIKVSRLAFEGLSPARRLHAGLNSGLMCKGLYSAL